MTAVPDAYGTDLLVGPDGDLVVSPAGDLATIDGPMNCAQALAMRLRTTPGELDMHPDYGSQLARRLIGRKALDDTFAQSLAAGELRALMQTDRRFLAASNVTAQTLTSDMAPARVRVSAQLELAGGEVLTVSDLSQPRLDEVTVAEPTLTDLTTAPDVELAAVEAVVDTDSELPELADLLATSDYADPTVPDA